MAGSVNIKIKQSAYTNAINQLQSKLKELEGARELYNQQREQIPNFWEGDAADKAYETIGQAIEQVKTAAQSVEENIAAIQKAQDEANQMDNETRQSIEDAKKAIQDLFT